MEQEIGRRFSIRDSSEKRSAEPAQYNFQAENGAGFTMIELLITLAIIVVIFGFGVFMSFDFYRGLAITGERDTVVALLKRARTRAVNNVNEMSHGLYIATTTFVLFNGPSYASRTVALDESFPRHSGISVSGSSTVVFQNLSGDSSVSGTISFGNSRTTTSIDINREGRVNWR